MSRVLITGAAGFIGANLASKLVQEGWDVIGLDNLSRGDFARIEHLVGKNFAFIEADIRDADSVLRAAEGVSQIVHLAEAKIPRYGKSIETLDINVEGTEILLAAAARNRARFIFGSTDEVYGKNIQSPLSEESALIMGQPQVARWSFGVSKMLAEHLCFAYREKHEISMTILRFSGVYGPGQPLDWQGGPQSVFITTALKEEPIPVHGDGLQTRVLTFIDDVVAGTIMTMKSNYAEGEIINIGSREAINIISLAYLIRRLVGHDAKQAIEFIPYTDFSRHYEDSRSRVLDISKAYYLLGYEPRVTLTEGLKQTIQWQADRLGISYAG